MRKELPAVGINKSSTRGRRRATFRRWTATIVGATLGVVALSCGSGSENTTTPPIATQLALITGAAGSANGEPFATQPVVAIRDPSGATVTTDDGSLVTMTVSGGATVVGTATVQALGGVASFTNVGISGTGTNFTLTFSRPGLTSVSQNIPLGAGPATQLALTTSAAGAPNGAAFITQPVVAIRDANGNTVTSSTAAVTLSVNMGGTIVGTTTVNAVAGIAAFTSVGLRGATPSSTTSYALIFASAGLTPVTQSISLSPGVATQLSLTIAAAGASSGQAFTTQPVVAIKDAAGNTVTSGSTTVTMTVSATGAVVGTATVSAASGVATFANVGISGTAGATYNLTFTASNLTSATQSITLTPGVVAAVTVSPNSVSLMPVQSQQLSATVKDATGNTVSGVPVIWKSTDTTVATVSSNGLATAGNVGTTTITATSNGKSATTVVTVLALTFTATSAGAVHTCGLTSTAAMYCWGDNTYCELGGGPVSTIADICGVSSDSPVISQAGFIFTTVTAGGGFTCGTTISGAAYCWGDGIWGELGVGTFDDLSETPGAVAGGLVFTALSAGSQHTCGLSSAGAPYCWGYNAYGQLGDGTTAFRLGPVAVQGGLQFSALTAGAEHTCGLTSAGAAYCWGDNTNGDLGDGTTTQRLAPVAVQGGLAFRALTAGGDHTCGLTGTGAAYCWGDNTNGDLGDGTTTQRMAPVPVLGGLVFKTLVAGSLQTCGLTNAGAAYCWGYNSDGELGDGTTIQRMSPSAVQGGVLFTTLTGGSEHTCGLTGAGVAYCWGSNSSGQLGVGTGTNRLTPTAVITP